MSNKSTQIVIIIGIIAVIGGAVYASLSLVKKQPGQTTNTANSTTATNVGVNGVLMNIESNLAGNRTFLRPFFVPSVTAMKLTITLTSADITIINPAGVTTTAANAAAQGAKYSFDEKKNQAIFTISSPATGTWEVQLISTVEDSHPFAVFVEAPTNEAAVIVATKLSYAAGEDIVITATASDRSQPVPEARWDIVYGPYTGVTPINVLPLVVLDDGNHSDGQANDGVFGGTISGAGLQGKYHIEGDVLFPSGLNLNTVTIVETPPAQ